MSSRLTSDQQKANLKAWRGHVSQVHNWPVKDGPMRLYTKLSDVQYLVTQHRKFEPLCEFGKAEEAQEQARREAMMVRSDEANARRFVSQFKESYPSLTVDFVLGRMKALRGGAKPEGAIDLWLTGGQDQSDVTDIRLS